MAAPSALARHAALYLLIAGLVTSGSLSAIRTTSAITGFANVVLNSDQTDAGGSRASIQRVSSRRMR